MPFIKEKVIEPRGNYEKFTTLSKYNSKLLRSSKFTQFQK